jgi:hypothetical protein
MGKDKNIESTVKENLIEMEKERIRLMEKIQKIVRESDNFSINADTEQNEDENDLFESNLTEDNIYQPVASTNNNQLYTDRTLNSKKGNADKNNAKMDK